MLCEGSVADRKLYPNVACGVNLAKLSTSVASRRMINIYILYMNIIYTICIMQYSNKMLLYFRRCVHYFGNQFEWGRMTHSYFEPLTDAGRLGSTLINWAQSGVPILHNNIAHQ